MYGTALLAQNVEEIALVVSWRGLVKHATVRLVLIPVAAQHDVCWSASPAVHGVQKHVLGPTIRSPSLLSVVVSVQCLFASPATLYSMHAYVLQYTKHVFSSGSMGGYRKHVLQYTKHVLYVHNVHVNNECVGYTR